MDDAVEIDAPAEVVWSVLTDLEQYGEWNPFIIRCRSTLEVGAPIDMVVNHIMPKPMKMREWIRSHTPGREFSYSMKPVPLGALRSERSHKVTQLGPDRCRYESHFQLAGWLSPLVGLLFGGGFRKGFPGMVTGVQRRAEQLHAG
ncbi:SRPBCC domain-containing protein [Nocardia donostiensis]|uniref:SRPBCC domain-containing protein n=1 Tax=Nocardia donostiensis TaxID=1538463 RepID=UPI0020CAA5B6|nr:SRPBCC domain-containing protein [Nocardia donostiensis]